MLAALGAGRAIGWPALPCAHVQRVVAELDAMLAGKRPDPRRSVEGYYTAYAVPYPAARRPGLCIWCARYTARQWRCVQHVGHAHTWALPRWGHLP
eukprot:366391-Chlamydomonas_euryale.AAC.31